MSNQSVADLKLEVGRAEGSADLRLRYRATNLTKRPLFLFNTLHGEMTEAGVFPLDTGAYAEIREGSVVLSCKLFPVPDMMLVETRNLPFVTRLQPAESIVETISVPLPVKPRDPYRDQRSESSSAPKRYPLFFELGYFVGAPGTEKLARTFPTDHGPRPGFDAFDEAAQRFTKVGPLGSVYASVTASRG